MAEEERKTKAERREEKRLRRQEEEAEREAAQRRQTIRNGAIALTLVLVLGGLTFLAVGNLDSEVPEDGITVAAADIEEAREASGCEVLNIQPVGTNQHIEPAEAPPANVLYTQGRPTATGPHYTNPGPIFSGVRDEQLDERATTHNMEHGSVIIWFDPEQVSSDDVDEIDDLVGQLNDAGFAENNGRAGILASPFTDPGIDSGKAIAIRSWGQGMDCDAWDIDYAHGWIAENFGSRGPAPEAALGQYPTGVLEIADGESSGDEETEPAGDESESAADDTASEGESAGDEPTEDASAEPTADETSTEE